MLLVEGTSFTRAYIWLKDASDPAGTVIEYRTSHKYNNMTRLEQMVARGLLETRRSGPRGGKRYHTTEKGMAALRCADLAYQIENNLIK